MCDDAWGGGPQHPPQQLASWEHTMSHTGVGHQGWSCCRVVNRQASFLPGRTCTSGCCRGPPALLISVIRGHLHRSSTRRTAGRNVLTGSPGRTDSDIMEEELLHAYVDCSKRAQSSCSPGCCWGAIWLAPLGCPRCSSLSSISTSCGHLEGVFLGQLDPSCHRMLAPRDPSSLPSSDRRRRPALVRARPARSRGSLAVAVLTDAPSQLDCLCAGIQTP